MEQLAQSEIFFFITSIAVLFFVVIFTIAGVYIIKILKNFSDISKKLKDGVDEAGEEIKDITEHVRESAIFSFIFGKRKRSKKR